MPTWRSAALLTLAFATLLLSPLIFFDQFPSTDGPAHLETATIFREYHQPGREALREQYLRDLRPIPNWSATAALIALTTITPPLVAEKLLVAAYVLGLPLVMLYLLVGIQRRAGFLALLSLPLVYGYVLYMGFYGFLSGLVLLLFLLGWWWRRRDALRRRHLPVMAVLSLLIYFGHPITAVIGWALVIGLTCWLALLDVSAGERSRGRGPAQTARALGTALRRRMLLPLTAFAPGMVLLSVFLWQAGGGPWERLSLALMARRLLTLDFMAVHQDRETPVALAMAALLGLLIARVVWQQASRWRRLQLTPGDGWALVALLSVVAYFLSPEFMAGGGYILRRMNLVVVLLMLPLLALGSFSVLSRRLVAVAGGALAVLLLSLQLPTWRATDLARRELLAVAAHMEPGSTFAPLLATELGVHPGGWVLSAHTGPLANAASLLAMQRQAVNLYHYQPQTGHFPIAYRDSVRYRELLYTRTRPTRIDLAAFCEQTGWLPRYLVLWGTFEQLSVGEADLARFGYQRHTTPGLEYVHLLERDSRVGSH